MNKVEISNINLGRADCLAGRERNNPHGTGSEGHTQYELGYACGEAEMGKADIENQFKATKILVKAIMKPLPEPPPRDYEAERLENEKQTWMSIKDCVDDGSFSSNQRSVLYEIIEEIRKKVEK